MFTYQSASNLLRTDYVNLNGTAQIMWDFNLRLFFCDGDYKWNGDTFRQLDETSFGLMSFVAVRFFFLV